MPYQLDDRTRHLQQRWLAAAEDVQLSLTRLALALKAGFDPNEPRVPAGDRLVRHPAIRLVSLTGDTATGRDAGPDVDRATGNLAFRVSGDAQLVLRLVDPSPEHDLVGVWVDSVNSGSRDHQ